MKNLSRLFLLLLLPLTLCLPRFASATPTPSAPQAAYHPLADIFTNPNALISTAVADGTLYFLLYDRSLLKWDPITQSALPQATVPQAELLIGGDALRLLDYDSGTLLKLSAGACIADGAIDGSALSDERFSIKTAFCFDNFLYLLYTPSMEDWTAHRIACFNMAKPSVTILDIEDVQALAGYQSGKLLALLGDPLAGTPASPVVLDSQTGEVLQVLPALHANAGGIAYNALKNQILLCDNGQLLALCGEAWQAVHYVPQVDMTRLRLSGCLEDGTYLYLTDEALVLRGTAPDALPNLRPLVVKGHGFNRDALPQFMQTHPEIPLILDDAFYTDIDALFAALQSGSTDVDVYLMPDYFGIWRLIDKGYAQELSSYPALQAEISRMNPKVQQAITHNGQFSALPISLFFDSWLLRPDLLQEAGYDHPPATLCEYFEMLGEWEANQSTEFDFAFHLTPSSDFGLKRYPCIRMAVDAYIAQYEQPNSPLSFDSEVFRQVLCAIEALHYPAENVDHALSQSPLFSRFTKPPEAIFTLNEWNPLRIGVFSEHPEQLIARPPFEIGQAPRSNASMYLAIINPKSLSKQNAADFLAYMAQHQAPDNLVALYPNANEAIEHAPTVASLKQQQQELATLRELQLVADEAHQANISDAIAQMEQNFARFEKNRFSITAESIAAYRQVEPAMYIPRDSLYWNLIPAQRDDFDEILKRYAAGALDAEGLISQLDQKMQLMFLEQ